jgi:hypothetical protein
MGNMTVAERLTEIIAGLGESIVRPKINLLEKQIGDENKKRHFEMMIYLDEHPDDIEGAREKFGVVPYEETRNSWYQHEMM